MNILFLQEQPEILTKLADPNESNPGVGGTSFVTCQLAYAIHNSRLARESGIRVHIGCLGELVLPDSFFGIPIVLINKIKTDICWDSIVATGGFLDQLAANQIKLKYNRLIAWIHHPYDHDKIKKASKLNAELVSSGKFQYVSNVLLAGPHHHIDNIFCAERIRKAASATNNSVAKVIDTESESKRHRESYHIGYMGGLIPSKGFHLLAEQWPVIKSNLVAKGIDAKLHVIGSSDLYGFEQNHPRLPCEKKYGEFLETLLGNSVGRDVFFYGKMGENRSSVMENCTVAVVNPAGLGEAFPATILEWLTLGVPVITTNTYGCADAMRFLSSFSIQHYHELTNKLTWYLMQNIEQKRQVSEYCKNIGEMFSSQQSTIVCQWIMLFTTNNMDVLINEYLPAKTYLSAVKNLVFSFASITKIRLKRLKTQSLRQYYLTNK